MTQEPWPLQAEKQAASVSPNLGRGRRCGRSHPCQLQNPGTRDQTNRQHAYTELAEGPIFLTLQFRANQDYLGTIVVPAITKNRHSEYVRAVLEGVM